MKNSSFIAILFTSLVSACHSNQQAEINTKDSLSLHHDLKDSTELKVVQTLTRAGDMVKAESPDALVKFEHGYALPKVNDGVAQSPINIITLNLQSHNQHKSDLKFFGSIYEIENLGHTIQVDFAKGSVTMVNGKPYELKQLHFHTPSEHLVDGMTFPMEMHIVSKLNDSVKNGEAVYTVLAILYKVGRENNFLKEFLDYIPGEDGKFGLDSTKVRLHDLFADISNREKLTYYHYQGSLTTPPFTESVNWVISKKIFEASEEQIARIGKIEGNNARHIHALNNRKIENE